MKRHEKMTAMIAAMTAAIAQYQEGLTLDTECLNTLLSELAPVHNDLIRCTLCGSDVKEMGPAIKSPEGYVPCCKDCYTKSQGVYLCVWGQGYINHDSLDEARQANNHLEFFTRENGYSDENIVAVKALEIGEALTLNEMGAIHTVVRTK